MAIGLFNKIGMHYFGKKYSKLTSKEAEEVRRLAGRGALQKRRRRRSTYLNRILR